MMTKEEIQRSITELQYQYQALIREGSYKLAQIRKERIKKLREQLKQLSKAKVQDSMDVLRLCGYTSDASVQVGPWTIYQEGNEISVHRGGRAWAQGFKSVQEAKAWIKQKEHWIETGKDEGPTFTKGSKDDDATEHGSIEQYGKGTKTESMGLSDDPVLAQDAGSSNPNVDVKKVISKGGRTAYGIYYKGYQVKVVNTIEEAYQKAETLGKLMSNKDGGPGSGIKGHRTPENEEPKKGSSSGYDDPEIQKIKEKWANKKSEGLGSEYGDLLSYLKKKATESGELPKMDEYYKLSDKLIEMRKKGKKDTEEYKAVERQKKDFNKKFNKVYKELESKAKSLSSESEQKRLDEVAQFAKKNKLKDSKPVKDANPKVAEAQAIINLCGGIF